MQVVAYYGAKEARRLSVSPFTTDFEPLHTDAANLAAIRDVPSRRQRLEMSYCCYLIYNAYRGCFCIEGHSMGGAYCG